METYTCQICGKTHEIYFGLDSPLPQILWNIDKEEYDERVDEMNGQYFLDKELMLIKGTILIYLKNEIEPYFNWQVWVSVTKEEFNKTLETVEKVGVSNTDSLCFKGKLESVLPFYDKSIGLSVYLKSNKEVSHFFIEVEEDSVLKEDQTNGVSKERVMELMNKVTSHNEYENQKSDKLFSEKFDEEIEFVQQNYISKGQSFAINIYTDGWASSQIVSSNILEIGGKATDFGIHLAFDDLKEELERFKKTTYSKAFNHVVLDEIPIYQLDVGTDLKRLKELIIRIAIDVYQEDIENVTLDSFSI